VSEWRFAEQDPAEELARLEYFTMKKGEVEFLITVKEFVSPRDPAVLFYACADKQTNQRHAPFTPCGWGRTLLDALAGCMQAVRDFPYEP